jgi:CSLREA domain-containing protein
LKCAGDLHLIKAEEGGGSPVKTKSVRFLLLLALIVSLSTPYSTAHASSIVVNSLEDNQVAGDDLCTLREAINNANADTDLTGGDCAAGGGIDGITFSVSGTINTGKPNLAADPGWLVINGTGQDVTISGSGTHRVFVIAEGAYLGLHHLTITGGFSGDGADGGGILNWGTLTMGNCVVSGNETGNNGGGLANLSVGSAVKATISDSTFSNNTAGQDGGGIWSGPESELTVTDSTFSNNHGTSAGGGIASYDSAIVANSTFYLNHAPGVAPAAGVGGAIFNSNSGFVTVTNSTIVSNVATFMGGLRINSGTATLRNTIVADNTGGNCSATRITNGGNNIDDGTTCGWGSTSGSMSNTDPLVAWHPQFLGIPAYFRLLSGSPAINAGDDATCAAEPVGNRSQNGQTRPQGAHCDIGSYEAKWYSIYLPLIMRGS